MTSQVSFKVRDKAEAVVIHKIAIRASRMAVTAGYDYPLMDISMDVTACHANGCLLRLEELLQAEDFDFAHDVFGIMAHLNRRTGRLEDCFLPRFADTRGSETP